MSALITVNTGQCGNQLGFDLIQSLYDHTIENPQQFETYFRNTNATNETRPIARAVCLDTEPKAILNCLQRTSRKSWQYDPSKCLYKHGGAGNNWAMGYNMCSGEFLESSLDCIRYCVFLNIMD